MNACPKSQKLLLCEQSRIWGTSLTCTKMRSGLLHREVNLELACKLQPDAIDAYLQLSIAHLGLQNMQASVPAAAARLTCDVKRFHIAK